MQHPHEEKRQLICAAAAKLFATRPFHEVRLDDVAAAAGVGKGTLYIYFDSKENLYSSLLHEGFAATLETLRQHAGADPAADSRQALRLIVEQLVSFAVQYPHISEIMRMPAEPTRHAQWVSKRQELCAIIEEVIRRGVRRGELRDPHPELTAQCVPGMVRSLFLFAPPDNKPQIIVDYIVGLLERGIGNPRGAPSP